MKSRQTRLNGMQLKVQEASSRPSSNEQMTLQAFKMRNIYITNSGNNEMTPSPAELGLMHSCLAGIQTIRLGDFIGMYSSD